MTERQTNTEYRENDADALVGELFSGGLSMTDAIERLRTRLLDLSSRNRLLNYRHPKGRCMQICDEPLLNLVFDRLFVDAKAVPLKPVPEPDPDSYEGKKPEARLYAPRAGISPSFEFKPDSSGSDGRRLHGLQTLFYPADLERQLRKIASEAKTAIEETGSNVLYMIFGFLEFYDSDESEKPLLAPLISLPVALTKGAVNQETRAYEYTVSHNGEDLAENHTLREKLRRDFILNLPEFEEEDEPEAWFAKVEQAVRTKRRWKVRRQITLGMLSFGKLAIWADLDTKKNGGLAEHRLLKSIFSGGGSGDGGGLHAEDYRIDEQPEAATPLIYDADSSQHSAIIDVLAGKNMVINGPPGTGKSQTITNVIASALAAGKKVLFVSEKLAALEVVRQRLNHAGLGSFCLELHSHKTQKKKFIEDIQDRMESGFPAPARYQAQLATLQRQKAELARYAELMGSRIGNGLGMTVHEIFWASERRRIELGEASPAVNHVSFQEAGQWGHDDLAFRRTRLEALGELHDQIGGYGPERPWWGFRPSVLGPADDDVVADVVGRALDHARAADDAAAGAVAEYGFRRQPSCEESVRIRDALDGAPVFPPGAMAELLAGMFGDERYPDGRRSTRVLENVAARVSRARKLREAASADLVEDPAMTPIHGVSHAKEAEGLLEPSALGRQIPETLAKLSDAKDALTELIDAARDSDGPWPAETGAEALELPLRMEGLRAHGLEVFPSRDVAARARLVLAEVDLLADALEIARGIAQRGDIPFDATPAAVMALADPSGPPGLAHTAPCDEAALSEAARLAAFPLGSVALSEISSIRSRLDEELAACSESLARCSAVMGRLGLEFDGSNASVREVEALSSMAVAAPRDLMEFRHGPLGHAGADAAIAAAEKAIALEAESRAKLSMLFHLDALPPVGEIRAAVTALRAKDGIFAFFDGAWRRAKALHAGLSREKRKLSGKGRAEELASIASWIEAREAFLADRRVSETLGSLHKGLDSDTDGAKRLRHWYLSTAEIFAACPGLADKVDPNAVPSPRLSELVASHASIAADVSRLSTVGETVRGILGADIAGMRDALSNGPAKALEVVRKAISGMDTVTSFFAPLASRESSPASIRLLMEAKAELARSRTPLDSLVHGDGRLKSAAGECLSAIIFVERANWIERLQWVRSETLKSEAVAKSAALFGDPAKPLSTAVRAARATGALLTASKGVLLKNPFAGCMSWSDMGSAVGERISRAQEILSEIAPDGRSGRSAKDIFSAHAALAEADADMVHLGAEPDVVELLGGAFAGEATDLARLSDTHEWGKAIHALGLPDGVRTSLLSPDAGDALERARDIYRRIASGWIGTSVTLDELERFGIFSAIEWFGGDRDADGTIRPCSVVDRMLDASEHLELVLPWTKYLSLRGQCNKERLGDFVSVLEDGRVPHELLGKAFELALFQSIGRSIYRDHPELQKFNGAAHDRVRDEFRRLDAEIISITGREFANKIDRAAKPPEGQRGAAVGDYTEMHLLRRETNKQRRHIPIRQLVKRAGRALQQLKPCFMMGPLSVAQYLEPGSLKFDIVVMDEASQLRPEEALGAIARGTQLVVVGDPKQLPPTSFFDRMLDSGDDEDDDDTPAVTSGMESILDICQQLFTPVRSLRWHYRSHHESLIAFSNHHFYKNLVVFPSPYAKNPGLGVKYRYVRDGSYKDRRNLQEAMRIVDAVLEHMLRRPDESLGIVTLNQTQRELIEELLDKKLKTFDEGAEYMSKWEAEGWPFFVKNLENVQGDERDVIMISTTYGKAPGTDKIRQNFGPISRPDGWRRLNVLFTRARRRVELYTSMGPEDIIVDEKTPLGTKALRDYLDFAKRGVLTSTDEGEREPDSDFEVAVADVIRSMNYEVKPQLGVAGFFIDMVVRNPDRPGEWLAAVECDGATYHSGFSVRDRDRIRQEILESLGWEGRIHRIWSTDWFYNPRREVERLRAFLEARRLASRNENPGEWEEKENFEDDLIEVDTDEPEVAEIVEAVSSASSGDEDLFVEVGDRVIYCFVDAPEERHSVLIVDSESNLRMGLINENTPVAKALLGMSPGDISELSLPGQKTRELRILKIQRQEELLV